MMEDYIGDIFPREEVKTYDCSEGDLVTDIGLDAVGNNQINRKFTNQIPQMSFLRLKANDPFTLELAPAGSTATHINQYSPEVSDALPKEDTDEADLSRRFVGGWQIKAGEFPLPLSETNSAIKAGDKLNISSTDGALDKTTASNNVVYALEAKDAGVGGLIRVNIQGNEIAVSS